MSCCGGGATALGALRATAVPAKPPRRTSTGASCARSRPAARISIFLVPDMHCAACLSRIEGALMEADGRHRRARQPDVAPRRRRFRSGIGRARPAARRGRVRSATPRGRSMPPPSTPPMATRVRRGADPRHGGRRLCRRQHHAALRLGLVGGGGRDARSLPLDLGADRAADDRLCRAALLPLRLQRRFARAPLNMDVPISLAVTLAAAMSLYETATHGEHAWFDAAVGLLFFLLVGRFLDHRMRGVARSAATRLLSLSARQRRAGRVPTARLRTSRSPTIAAGRSRAGRGRRARPRRRRRSSTASSDIDRSMLTGEAEPEAVGSGARVFAGTLNLTGPLTVEVDGEAGETLLAEIARLMEAAERARRPLRPHRRPRRAHLRAGGPCASRAATLFAWLARGRRMAPGADHCDRRPDHHLPLRARPCRPGGAGCGERAPDATRRHAEGRRARWSGLPA